MARGTLVRMRLLLDEDAEDWRFIQYAHSAITPVIVSPHQADVIPLILGLKNNALGLIPAS